jgi:hypothetical protein
MEPIGQTMSGPSPATIKPSKVVVACLDGQRLKGYVFNFSAVRDSLRLFPAENSPHEAGTDVKFQTLKAIFFVKDHEGHREHHDTYDMKTAGHGRKIEVTFRDGEKIMGSTEAYNPQKPGFFLFPADPEGNNIRIFVVNSNVQKVNIL